MLEPQGSAWAGRTDSGLDGRTQGWRPCKQADGLAGEERAHLGEGAQARAPLRREQRLSRDGFLTWRHPEALGLKQNYFLHLSVPVLEIWETARVQRWSSIRRDPKPITQSINAAADSAPPAQLLPERWRCTRGRAGPGCRILLTSQISLLAVICPDKRFSSSWKNTARSLGTSQHLASSGPFAGGETLK